MSGPKDSCTLTTFSFQPSYRINLIESVFKQKRRILMCDMSSLHLQVLLFSTIQAVL